MTFNMLAESCVLSRVPVPAMAANSAAVEDRLRAEDGAVVVGDGGVGLLAAALKIESGGAGECGLKNSVDDPERGGVGVADARCAAVVVRAERVDAEGHVDGLGSVVQHEQLGGERAVGRDEVVDAGSGCRAASVVLGEQVDLAAGDVFAEGQRPGVEVAAGGGAAKGHAGRHGNDGRAVLLPERLEDLDRPVAGVEAAAVGFALVAELYAEQGGAKLLHDVCDLPSGERRGGGARGRAAEVDAVDAAPARGAKEGGERVDVRGGDLADGLAGAIGGPHALVDGHAADTENARAETLEEAEQLRVGGGEEWRQERLLFVGEAEKAGLEGACASGIDDQRGNGDRANGRRLRNRCRRFAGAVSRAASPVVLQAALRAAAQEVSPVGYGWRHRLHSGRGADGADQRGTAASEHGAGGDGSQTVQKLTPGERMVRECRTENARSHLDFSCGCAFPQTSH